VNELDIAFYKQDADIETDDYKKQTFLKLYEQTKLKFEQQKVYFKAKNRIIRDFNDTQLRILQVPNELSLDILQELAKQLNELKQKAFVISNDKHLYNLLDIHSETIELRNIVFDTNRDKFVPIKIIDSVFRKEKELAKSLNISFQTLTCLQDLYYGNFFLKEGYIQRPEPEYLFDTFCKEVLKETNEKLSEYVKNLYVLDKYQSEHIKQYVEKILMQNEFDDIKGIAHLKQVSTVLIQFYTSLKIMEI
jgi:hypothetical protein